MKSRETRSTSQKQDIEPFKRPEEDKDKYKLIEDVDYIFEKHTHKPSDEEVRVVKLTDAGKTKTQDEKADYFNDEKPRVKLPLGKDFDLSTLDENTVFVIDRKLALSVIRTKTGGFYCEFSDGQKTLHDQSYEFIILKKDLENNLVTIVFDHWPGEFKKYVYIKDGSYAQIKGPITNGPKCTIDLQILIDGHPQEPFFDWLKNLVNRNFKRKP